MKKTRTQGKPEKILFAAGLLLALALVLLPTAARAADTEIYSIEITADLRQDGSATITEVWDVNAIGDMTEWYIVKTNHGDYPISNLSVTDESGNVFETVASWNVDWSFKEKAGKCGILDTGDGYELCWGVGSFGAHTYTVTYEIQNLVQGLNDADALSYTFIEHNLSSPPEHAKVTLRREGMEFSTDNTGVWAFGVEGAPYGAENGVVTFEATEGLGSNDYMALLCEFDKGMFAPPLSHNMNFEEALEQARQGSDYGTDYNGDDYDDSGWTFRFGSLFNGSNFIYIAVIIGIVMALFGAGSARKNGSGGRARMKPEYKDVSYSRELPYGGSLPATYSRLDELRQLPNEGTVIGAYFLRWIRSRQVEIVSAQGGLFGNKDETAIRLYDARPDMEPVERSLYDMLTRAAGRDWILQSKEFEKWSKKNFSTVQGWLERYKNIGANEIRAMGGVTEVQKKVLGLFTTTSTEATEKGEQLTKEMFGFKKYLQEFTIINERQAREVQLWDEYLVFAQVFGIAESVAEQFQKLYPDYFVKMAQDIGVRPDLFDLMIITHMASRYGRAMNDGYRAGYNAHVSRDSGGGGFSSGGGGFTSFGGGGFGGGGGGGGGR